LFRNKVQISTRIFLKEQLQKFHKFYVNKEKKSYQYASQKTAKVQLLFAPKIIAYARCLINFAPQKKYIQSFKDYKKN
jgi:hypothetical protein